MAPTVIRAASTDPFTSGFDRIIRDLGYPTRFPPAVTEAAKAAVPSADRRADRTDIPLITLDPVGSMDLDQAYWAERRPGGFRVVYAIADVAAFVRPGDPIDVESLERAVTLYAPDRRVPLHPPELSEGRASLLPNVDRPAVVWTFDLDDLGVVTDVHLERALVRSQAKLNYLEVDGWLQDGTAPDSVALLATIGPLREALERERGAVHLDLPSQAVVQTDRGYDIVYETNRPIERWNAQISLMTGMAAAQLMIDGGAGLLRTLPEPDPETVTELRLSAQALEVPWSAEVGYVERVRTLDRTDPAETTLLVQAARLLRGAGYLDFTEPPTGDFTHSAIAATYAHVTAPLRRVGDRYATEFALAAHDGREAASWALEAIPELPRQIASGRSRESTLDRAIVDFVEALLLESRLDETFEGVVTRLHKNGSATIQLREPAIVAVAEPDDWTLGTNVRLRVAEASPETGQVRFSSAGEPGNQ